LKKKGGSWQEDKIINGSRKILLNGKYPSILTKLQEIKEFLFIFFNQQKFFFNSRRRVS
jgi:hypothetical protein